MKDINIAIIGVGTVGKSVVKILQTNKDILKARCGVNLVPRIGISRDIDDKELKSLGIPLSTNIDDAFSDPSIEVIVELIGGVELPYEIALRALKSGKAFVTANKAMLAYHRYDLEKQCKNSAIGFEASVCGGIPIIKILKDGLGANHILSLSGIMNGTSNYILTKMSKSGLNFKVALKEAQDLGYAEADPTLDISGGDTAHKLLILASIAYGINAKLEDILVEGIEEISQIDILFAKEFGYVIKLLGIAKKEIHSDEVELRVHPCLISQDKLLAKVDKAMNAISVVGDMVGETVYYGAGAGGAPTASSVVSDILEIARSKTSPMLGYMSSHENTLKLKPIESISSKYYIRLNVTDKPGVLSDIALVFAKYKVSIRTLLQKETWEQDKTHKKDLDTTCIESKPKHATLLLSTHICAELDIQKALNEIEKLICVVCKPYMIRLLD
ncbi:homoserine dehydrogenase [Helicobacter sp. 13S00401-1]|uniref:homoserine dehydrogenase n=1 Tax=Helicobacter sp. 13S00401-1 TaxID=1905758 RepID=UPI000BA6A58F|nr:homoserine dehydrogenase [Helicobacter sp. 13S00401-1]PAF50903.1 homoserine dehydrogenase [Helicobacter sp. 13S00401-1]